MPLTGVPPSYRRGFSFTQHAIDQPAAPPPGRRLDEEFDDIASALDGAAAPLQRLLDASGNLRPGIISAAQLVPGLFNAVAVDATRAVRPLLDIAEAIEQRMARSQANVDAALQVVLTSAQVAHAEAASAVYAADQAGQFAISTVQSEKAIEDDVARAENAATSAEASEGVALAYKDLAFKWAEYLAGPVDPAPPGWPEAIDDGLWSAKWWAVRAREIVGDWGNWYLGAASAAPAVPAAGPWPPGQMYYDTTAGQMMVWSGTAWGPLVAPALGVVASFVYFAAGGQKDYAGADANGLAPVIDPVNPEPSDVHVNGVRLVAGPDYTIDASTSTLTIAVGLAAGSVVQWDLLVNPVSVAPGAVTAYKVSDVASFFDGLRTSFPLVYNPGTGNVPATPSDGVQLQIVLDGVPQEMGADFTTSADNVVFTLPPPTGTRFSGVWYRPGA